MTERGKPPVGAALHGLGDLAAVGGLATAKSDLIRRTMAAFIMHATTVAAPIAPRSL